MMSKNTSIYAETRFGLLPRDIQKIIIDYVEWTDRIYEKWTNDMYKEIIEPKIKVKSFYNEDVIKDHIMMILKESYGVDLFKYFNNVGSPFFRSNSLVVGEILDAKILDKLYLSQIYRHISFKDRLYSLVNETYKSLNINNRFKVIESFNILIRWNFREHLIPITSDMTGKDLYWIVENLITDKGVDLNNIILILQNPYKQFEHIITANHIPMYEFGVIPMSIIDMEIREPVVRRRILECVSPF